MAARKQTTDRVSKIAAKWLRAYRRELRVFEGTKMPALHWAAITWRDLVALCGSALSQDEVKGKRTAKRRRAK